MTSFMYFNLIYIDNQNKSVEKIPIAVRNISSIYDMAGKILDSERESLVLLLFEDGTRIDENEYLQSLNDDTELFICSKEQHEKLSTYFLFKIFLTALN